MQELTFDEIDAISGAVKPSEGLGAVSGVLWGAAEVSALIPGRALLLSWGWVLVS